MRWALLFVLASCDDHLFLPHGGGGGGGGGGGEDGNWCGILQSNCLTCHSAAVASGGLDLETDPYAALVNVPSSVGPILVVPGDPGTSFLMTKLEGNLEPGQGLVMPPTGPLPSDRLEVIRQWIADGAPQECAGGTTGAPTQGVHPPEWPEPIHHGTAAKLGTLRCATAGCHGATLQGEGGPSCASCHDPLLPPDLLEDGVDSWTRWCTFCHGDRASNIAAPPQDIDDTKPNDISFEAHLAHVGPTELHDGFDCIECHQKPADIFSEGHLQFGGDTSEGTAEVQFLGIAQGGSYQGSTCAVYCHSPEPGSNLQVDLDDTVECGNCHGVLSNEDSWRTRLSPPHEKHIDEEIICAECHANVNGQGNTILDLSLHVNGSVQINPPNGFTYNEANRTCTGTCHDEPHNNRIWNDEGDDDTTDDDGTDDSP